MPNQFVGVQASTARPGHKRRGMRRPRGSRAVLACTVTTVLLVAGVGTATAQRVEFSDAAGDMTGFTESSDGVTATAAPDHHAGDITSAVVRHRRHKVTVKLSYAQLRRSHFNAVLGKVRTDTVTRYVFVQDQVDAPPEVHVFNRRFKPVCPGATLHMDYKANTVAIRVPRKCLKRPDWVKAAAISANDKADGSNTYYLDDAFSSTPVEDPEAQGTWSTRVNHH